MGRFRYCIREEQSPAAVAAAVAKRHSGIAGARDRIVAKAMARPVAAPVVGAIVRVAASEGSNARPPGPLASELHAFELRDGCERDGVLRRDVCPGRPNKVGRTRQQWGVDSDLSLTGAGVDGCSLRSGRGATVQRRVPKL